MKIGVLICDDVNPALEPEFGNYQAMFCRILLQQNPSLQLRFYCAHLGELPQSVDDCEAYVTSGSKFSVMDGEPWIDRLQAFVLAVHQASVPFVGICFGHQLLAKALGGKVEKVGRGWGVGCSQTLVHVNRPWMRPYQSKLNLLVSHQDQVVELPEHGEAIAGNDFCPNSMIQIGATSLGIQAHPEFCVGYSRGLMQVRRDSIGEQRTDQGLQSLKLPTDSLLVTQWIVQFLTRH